MKPIIRVENLGKEYRIGASEARYATLRDTISGALREPLKRLRRNGNKGKNSVWALREISFDVEPGEVVGVIGRNGAGKSTLLKVLSRITEPTVGRVQLYGRVGSLLEVGTGFHPELTGRENIYLSGAIMGMKKGEIERKFDGIVDFAEIEKFLDTPVKRYSSGMYMRLAFAVAAHLEPEILLVDEVLAVGDSAFQKKCLGKMGSVASEGRTVLFVSHSLGSVVSLCSRCLLIEKGTLALDGPASQVTAFYQSSLYSASESSADLSNVERYGTGTARFTSVQVTPLGRDGSPQPVLLTGQNLKIDVKIKGLVEIVNANLALIIYDSAGHRIIDANTALRGSFLKLAPGQEAHVEFNLIDVLLKPGVYLLGLWIGRGELSEDIDGITYATSFSVEPDAEELMYSVTFPGVYQCRFTHVVEVSETVQR